MMHPLNCSRMHLVTVARLFATSEFGLKLLDATSSIDKTFLPRKYRMGIGGDVLYKDIILNFTNFFLTLGLHSRMRKKLLARRYVLETSWK
jgi:hypothetical protein